MTFYFVVVIIVLMKRTIIIEILLLFILAILLLVIISSWNNLHILLGMYEGDDWGLFVKNYNVANAITFPILYTFAAIADVAAFVLIALKDYKPLADKLAAHKTARQQAKVERAEADKQAKIFELEKQLEELKKD